MQKEQTLAQSLEQNKKPFYVKSGEERNQFSLPGIARMIEKKDKIEGRLGQGLAKLMKNINKQ
jgi:hypothetical protein